VLADGGYRNSPAITNVREQGNRPAHPHRDRRRSRPRTLLPRQGDEARPIEAVVSRPFIRRTDRFLCRGLAEWQLIAATNNLLKLWRASLAQAATAIPEPLAD
jgi:hypothetical protein